MKNIMKYLLACMLAPAIVLGMEPDRKKVCRDEPLSDALEQCVSRAQTSHTLEINGYLQVEVKELLYSVKQCTLLANRIRALPLHTVKLKNLMDDVDIPIEGLKTISAHDLSSFLCTLTQKRIDRLGLDGNCLGFRCNKPACRRIIDALRLMTDSLQALSLRNNYLNRFSAADWHALGSVIDGLKELDLGGNNLGLPFRPLMSDDSWRVLLDELTRSKIEKLGMKDNFLCQVSDVTWNLFTHTIARMQNLKVLDLRWNSLEAISYERFELLASSLLCHDGMTVSIRNSDDPHHWWARLRDDRGLNVVIQ